MLSVYYRLISRWACAYLQPSSKAFPQNSVDVATLGLKSQMHKGKLGLELHRIATTQDKKSPVASCRKLNDAATKNTWAAFMSLVSKAEKVSLVSNKDKWRSHLSTTWHIHMAEYAKVVASQELVSYDMRDKRRMSMACGQTLTGETRLA